jgi:hypothetical protein
MDAANDFVFKDILGPNLFCLYTSLLVALVYSGWFPLLCNPTRLRLKGFAVAVDRLMHAYVCYQDAMALCSLYVL